VELGQTLRGMLELVASAVAHEVAPPFHDMREGNEPSRAPHLGVDGKTLLSGRILTGGERVTSPPSLLPDGIPQSPWAVGKADGLTCHDSSASSILPAHPPQLRAGPSSMDDRNKRPHEFGFRR
jgi:hypothetical protein